MEVLDVIHRLAVPSNDRPNTTNAANPLTEVSMAASRLPPTFDIQRLSTEDAGPTVKTGIWALVAVSGLFLVLRLCAKKKRRHISALNDTSTSTSTSIPRRRRSLYWDDWVLINAWAALLATGVFTHAAVDLGYGKHSHAVDARNLPSLAVAGLVSCTCSIAAQAWSKTGFALTLLRLTRGGRGRVRAFILVNVVLVNVVFAVGAVLFWVQCVPLERLWRPFPAEGRCMDPRINVVYGIIVGGQSPC